MDYSYSYVIWNICSNFDVCGNWLHFVFFQLCGFCPKNVGKYKIKDLKNLFFQNIYIQRKLTALRIS